MLKQVLLGFALGFLSCYCLMTLGQTPSEYITTVAHIELPEHKFELVTRDDATDTAQYAILDTEHWASIGDAVSFVNGSSGTIIGADTSGFTVKMDENNFVVADMSGTAVFKNDVQIGYVSARVSGNIRCIWY